MELTSYSCYAETDNMSFSELLDLYTDLVERAVLALDREREQLSYIAPDMESVRNEIILRHYGPKGTGT